MHHNDGYDYATSKVAIAISILVIGDNSIAQDRMAVKMSASPVI